MEGITIPRLQAAILEKPNNDPCLEVVTLICFAFPSRMHLVRFHLAPPGTGTAMTTGAEMIGAARMTGAVMTTGAEA